MEETIENTTETAHVRLYVPTNNHGRAKRLTKIISAKNVLEKKEMTAAKLHDTYLTALEIGLTALEQQHQ